MSRIKKVRVSGKKKKKPASFIPKQIKRANKKQVPKTGLGSDDYKICNIKLL